MNPTTPCEPLALATLALETPCPKKLRRALGVLQCSLDARVSLEDLARHVAVNKFYLCHLFRRYFRAPPSTLHRALRLVRAAELLRNGMPPSAAAAETGWADQSHLSRHFARAFGMPPGAYARAHEG